jgi:TonB family protein
VEAAQADAADADIERTLDGVTLSGPAAGRDIEQHELPAYPAWATQQAVEATVTLYFIVLPDGRVKDNVQIRKTGGYADFDDNATNALLRWRFAPLPAGQRQEQWGTITFRYRLRDVRR